MAGGTALQLLGYLVYEVVLLDPLGAHLEQLVVQRPSGEVFRLHPGDVFATVMYLEIGASCLVYLIQ